MRPSSLSKPASECRQDDNGDDQETDGDDPGKEELRECDADGDVRDAGREIERELTHGLDY